MKTATQKCQRESQNGSFPHSPQRILTLPTLRFQALASTTETINFCCLRHSVCRILLRQPQQTTIQPSRIIFYLVALHSSRASPFFIGALTFGLWKEQESMWRVTQEFYGAGMEGTYMSSAYISLARSQSHGKT